MPWPGWEACGGDAAADPQLPGHRRQGQLGAGQPRRFSGSAKAVYPVQLPITVIKCIFSFDLQKQASNSVGWLQSVLIVCILHIQCLEMQTDFSQISNQIQVCPILSAKKENTNCLYICLVHNYFLIVVQLYVPSWQKLILKSSGIVLMFLIIDLLRIAGVINICGRPL